MAKKNEKTEEHFETIHRAIQLSVALIDRLKSSITGHNFHCVKSSLELYINVINTTKKSNNICSFYISLSLPVDMICFF